MFLAEARLNRLREHEQALRLDDRITYDDFAFRVQRTRADVVEFVRREHARGVPANTAIRWWAVNAIEIETPHGPATESSALIKREVGSRAPDASNAAPSGSTHATTTTTLRSK